jgi:3-phosphoshikimate 1-carboxyvinyltransferase
MIEEPLRDLGVEVSTQKGFLPVKVKGPYSAGFTFVDGSQSSQFLTGLLMSLPLAEEDSEIVVDHLKSTPYVDMTLKLMRDFGVGAKHFDHRIFEVKGQQNYQSRDYYVEGDWSGVAFLLVAGAIGGEVKVTGIDLESAQADIQVLEALEMAGAKLERGEDTVKVSSADLSAFEMDITDCPDLAPPLVCLAANCKGITRLKGAKRLLIKESNRAKTLQEEFEKLGIKIELKEDELLITGGKVKSGNVYSHRDHRIAMAGAVAAIKADGPVFIEHSECVSKSWPGFFKDLKKIGGIVNE